MKQFFLLLLLILIFITGCKKVNPVSRTSEGVVPVPPTVGAINVAPQVFAGGDLRVALPADSVILYGTFNDTPTDTVQHTWRKISGPFSYSIEKYQSLTTKVYKLQEGIYEFELTVTDKGGLTGKDTVAVDVYKLNTAPQAFAGGDLRVALPADSVILNGTFNDTPTDTVQHTWRKISGPFSYSIEKSQSLTTKVYKLQEGIYKFELTVTDKGGLTGKDTVAVDVYKPLIAPSNGLIFKDLIWIFPWFSTLEVKNINLYSPPLKVFVKRDFDSTWIEVSPHSNSTNTTVYEYFIETRPDGGGIYTYGSLYIFYYGTNTSDTPDVKITF